MTPGGKTAAAVARKKWATTPSPNATQRRDDGGDIGMTAVTTVMTAVATTVTAAG